MGQTQDNTFRTEVEEQIEENVDIARDAPLLVKKAILLSLASYEPTSKETLHYLNEKSKRYGKQFFKTIIPAKMTDKEEVSYFIAEDTDDKNIYISFHGLRGNREFLDIIFERQECQAGKLKRKNCFQRFIKQFPFATVFRKEWLVPIFKTYYIYHKFSYVMLDLGRVLI